MRKLKKVLLFVCLFGTISISGCSNRLNSNKRVEKMFLNEGKINIDGSYVFEEIKTEDSEEYGCKAIRLLSFSHKTNTNRYVLEEKITFVFNQYTEFEYYVSITFDWGKILNGSYYGYAESKNKNSNLFYKSDFVYYDISINDNDKFSTNYSYRIINDNLKNYSGNELENLVNNCFEMFDSCYSYGRYQLLRHGLNAVLK